MLFFENQTRARGCCESKADCESKKAFFVHKVVGKSFLFIFEKGVYPQFPRRNKVFFRGGG